METLCLSYHDLPSTYEGWTDATIGNDGCVQHGVSSSCIHSQSEASSDVSQGGGGPWAHLKQ